MTMRVIEIIVVIAAIASPAAAAPEAIVSGTANGSDVESRYTTAYINCSGFKTGVTPVMLDCIAKENDIQDGRLNLAFAATMRALSPSRQVRLRTAEREWIAYRDAWCGITYDKDSGQDAHLASNECMLHETIRQTIKLEALAWDAAAG
jgi:uncharacterized protein YecT (DUF1311 family)